MDINEIKFLSNLIDDYKLFNSNLNDKYFIDTLNNSNSKFIHFINNVQSNKEDVDQFSFGINCLQVFVLINWIYTKNLKLNNDIIEILKDINQDDLKNELNLDYSDYQPTIIHPELLYIAKLIFKNQPNNNLIYLIWKLRYLIVYQSILNRIDNSFTDDLISLIQQQLINLNDQKLKMRFLLEICQYNLIQNKVQNLRELLKDANNCTKLNIKLSGALGKRTHFQQEAKSILFLNLTRESIEQFDEQLDENLSTKLNSNQIDTPRIMNLTDDTLLNKPIFLNGESLNQNQIQLSDDEETLLLAIVKYGSKCGINQDNLLKEELLTYLEHLISKSTVWAVIFESMYQRSIFESSERRKVERSMLQLNELIDKINNSELNDQYTKLHLFYSGLITPIWRIKRKLADILVTLGCVKEALSMYIELDLWEEIVFCYKQIQRRDKAAEIIRQQLEIKETPYLYCLLGDATDEIQYYEKAWQLSNEKSYLAQKRLGYYYFDLKDYTKAIDCFKKSIDLNPMQLDTLQRLGYSALLVENYELATMAYRRVVESDLDNFQAWNNLSKAYIKLNDKQRAFRTLQEALKSNYENWKIWENYIVVCVDIGAFNEVINAWNRLIDIKSKYEDDEIMNILVNYLCSIVDDDSSIKNLHKRTLKLLGRMTSNFQCSSTLWLLYAKLLINLDRKSNEEKIFNCLLKAQRSLMSKAGWDKNSDDILDNLKSLNTIFNYYKEILNETKDEEQKKRHLTSFKLSASNMISLIKNNVDYWSNNEIIKEKVQSNLNDIESKLNSNEF